MKRTTSPHHAANLFADSDDSAGQAPTIVTASDLNTWQEELAHAVEASGQALNPADLFQLSKAILAGTGFTRNRLVNSSALLWQRGTSIAVALPFVYTADRWLASAGDNGAATVSLGLTDTVADAFLLQQFDPIPGTQLRFDQTVAADASSGNTPILSQKIEGVTTLAGRRAVFSFAARLPTGAPAPLLCSIALRQVFGSGGSASVVVTPTPAAAVIQNTGLWQRVAFVADLPSVESKTIGPDSYLEVALIFPPFVTFQFRGTAFLLEPGGVASSYVLPPPAFEEQRCMRFFEKSYEIATAPGTATHAGEIARAVPFNGSGVSLYQELATRFRVEKRGTPTVTWYNPVSGAANALNEHVVSSGADTSRAVASTVLPSRSSTGRPTQGATGTASVVSVMQGQFTASAEL